MKKKLLLLLTILFCSVLSAAPKLLRADWKKLSVLEKDIALLTACWMEEYDIDYSDFNYALSKDILKREWNIDSKFELIKEVKAGFENGYSAVFAAGTKLIDTNPQKTPAQISIEQEYGRTNAGYLFYIYDIRSKVGVHGFEAYDISKSLLLLRLGFAASLISKSELEEYAQPLIQKALSDYVSIQDFAGHFIATCVLSTISSYKYYKTVDDEVAAWTNAVNILPPKDINFTGLTADRTAIMQIQDGVYIPSEYSSQLIELTKLPGGGYGADGIKLIKEARERYGELVFLDSLYENLEPVRFNKKGTEAPADFFEREYRLLWDSLEEYEKFAIAASSNVLERNNQFHLDLSNRVIFPKVSWTGKEILKDTWGITGKEELMNSYEELGRGEQAAVYLKLKNLLLKYPELSVLEIGTKEALTVTEISRMYFVKDKMLLLGEHGLEAWIDARRIAILRWGIGAGYISLNEAVELIKPIAEKIKGDYTSFEDFIAHWIAGYCYNEVFSSTCPDCTIDLIKAIETARAYIPFEELNFTGSAADPNHSMTIKEAVYTPSETAQKMIPFQKLYKAHNSPEVYEELVALEEENPEYKNALFYYHLILMVEYSTSRERLDFVESNLDYLNSIPQTSEVFDDVIFQYMHDLTMCYEPEKVLSLYESLSDMLKTNLRIYYYYAYANYEMANLSTNVFERDIYISRAVNAFNQLKKRGYLLGTFIECWLNTMESL